MFSVIEFRFLFWLDISCLCLTYRLYQNKCGSLLPKIVRWKYHRVVMAMECGELGWRSSSGHVRGEKHMRSPCTDGQNSLKNLRRMGNPGATV